MDKLKTRNKKLIILNIGVALAIVVSFVGAIISAKAYRFHTSEYFTNAKMVSASAEYTNEGVVELIDGVSEKDEAVFVFRSLKRGTTEATITYSMEYPKNEEHPDGVIIQRTVSGKFTVGIFGIIIDRSMLVNFSGFGIFIYCLMFVLLLTVVIMLWSFIDSFRKGAFSYAMVANGGIGIFAAILLLITAYKLYNNAVRTLTGYLVIVNEVGGWVIVLLAPVMFFLAAFLFYASGMGVGKFLAVATELRVVHAYLVSFGTSLAAALVNAVFGLLLAWVLVRYDFPGKRLLDGLIDLPFALPTAVAGIALTTLYAENGWLGRFFYAAGIPSAFSVLGITIALVFVGIPFVARSVQPVLEGLDPQLEEAAEMLGASRWLTFRRVVFPELLSPLLTGFALAFARGIGEYGSVVFIAGNLPYETEIAPLLIMAKLESFDYPSAAAIAIVMMAASFLVLLALNGYQRWRMHHQGV